MGNKKGKSSGNEKKKQRAERSLIGKVKRPRSQDKEIGGGSDGKKRRERKKEEKGTKRAMDDNEA